MDWRSFVMHTYEKLKKQHPDKTVTLKHAMIAAKGPYRKAQQDMFRVRGELVESHRDLAARLPGKARKKNTKRADRIEAVQYAGVLHSMRDRGWDEY